MQAPDCDCRAYHVTFIYSDVGGHGARAGPLGRSMGDETTMPGRTVLPTSQLV